MKIELWAKAPEQNNGWHKITARYSFWYIDVSMDGSSLVRKYRYGLIGRLYQKYFEKGTPFKGKLALVSIWKYGAAGGDNQDV